MTFDTIKLSHQKNYAIVQIDNGKVNAINTPLLKDLKNVLEVLDRDEKVKGVMLAGRPKAFSAGLDIVSIALMDEAQRFEFWVLYMNVLQAMIELSKPIVSAITGYAPAAATILTLCTDYRVMAKGEKYVMGMHEFKLQMQIPEMWCEIYAYHLGEVNAWKAVQQSRLFNSDEALAIGLVDESVEVEAVVERAEKHLLKLTQVYGKVFQYSKEIFRRGLHKIVVERDIEELAKKQIAFNKDPFLAGMVKAFVATLKK